MCDEISYFSYTSYAIFSLKNQLESNIFSWKIFHNKSFFIKLQLLSSHKWNFHSWRQYFKHFYIVTYLSVLRDKIVNKKFDNCAFKFLFMFEKFYFIFYDSLVRICNYYRIVFRFYFMIESIFFFYFSKSTSNIEKRNIQLEYTVQNRVGRKKPKCLSSKHNSAEKCAFRNK